MTRVMAEGLEFPEGPVALDDGSVLVVEIKRQTITLLAGRFDKGGCRNRRRTQRNGDWP